MLEFQPEYEVFEGQARTCNTIPVYCSLLSDQLTPVSAFRCLADECDHAFLLESVIGGEKIARYSFLSVAPSVRIEARGAQAVIHEGGQTRTIDDCDPLQALEELLAKYQTVHPKGLPRFVGGAVGYAAYDIARLYEKLPEPPPDDRNLPDLQFGIYDNMVIFDHVRKLVHVVAHASTDGTEPAAAYADACARVTSTVEALGRIKLDAPRPIVEGPVDAVAYESNFTREDFMKVVDRVKEYIRAGDIFQGVISQRLSATTAADPFDIYRALRVISPSPFMFFLKTPSVTLVGASPEILCRIEGRTVTARPLAGTRPRGRNEAEDRGLEMELLADPKERAEHVMLVDLGRNDLARVCDPETVKVDELMTVERYSHVMHICSSLSGTLAKGKTAFDAIRSVLPVGTVSGAPKIRAMQIIDEMETVRRGPYAGAVGYIDFAGNMDTCIALRTLVITPGENGMSNVYAQVGAGIVADSAPADEYQETLNKAQSMLRALHVADAWVSEEQ